MRKLLVVFMLFVIPSVLAAEGLMSMKVVGINGSQVFMQSGSWFSFLSCQSGLDVNVTVPFTFELNRTQCINEFNLTSTLDECKEMYSLIQTEQECRTVFDLLPHANFTCLIEDIPGYNSSILSMSEDELLWKLQNASMTDYYSLRIWLLQTVMPELNRYNNLTAELDLRNEDILSYRDSLSQCSNSLNATKAEVVTAYKSADDRGVLLVCLLILVTVMVLSQAGIFSTLRHKW